MSQGVRPSIIMGVLAALLFSMIVATSAFIQLPAPGGFYGVRPRQAWPRFGARARPPSPSSSSSDVRMCITGLAAPFAWRKGVRSSRHQAVRQDAALQPPVRASTRRPFSLARAVLLGPFAFEVYNDPQRDQGRWQQWAQDTEVAVLDDAFLCELYRGEVTVKVLSVSEAATQARAGGKVLGHTKHQATESWLPNLLGFAGGSEGAGDAAKAQSSATNAVLGYTMGEECSGSLPMSLVAAARHAAEGSMTAAAAASYVATPMGAATPREQQAGVSFSACVRRSAPASSLNLTLSLEDDKALLGKAVVDLRSLVGEAGRQVGQSTLVRQEVQLTGGEGGLVVQLELSYTPFAFPAPPERAQPSTLAAAGQGVKQEEQEPWLGAKGCSRDWRKLARVVGEEAVSGKDMRLLAFLENRGTDAQLKVWRDEKRKRLIVAFRGTDPTRLGDLIIDLKLLQEPWDASKLDKQPAPVPEAVEGAAAKKQAEDAWMADLYSSLAWQANVTGMMLNELASSLSTASTSYLDYFKRAIISTTTLAPSPAPVMPPKRSPGTSACASDSATMGLISPHAVQLLQPPQLDYQHAPHHHQQQSLPSAFKAPGLLLTPLPTDAPSSSTASSSPPARERRGMLYWSRRLSRAANPSTPSPPSSPSSPSAVDQAVADVFTSVLDRVLGRLDPSATTFLQREDGRVLSAGDFRRAFTEVVGRASEHLGSQVLTTWADLQQQQEEQQQQQQAQKSQQEQRQQQHQQTVLDLLVLVGQAGSSPLVMLPTRFRHVFESLVHETLLSLRNEPEPAAATSSSTGSQPRVSKRTRLLSLAASSFKSIKANLTQQQQAPPEPRALREHEAAEEHPSQGDFRALLLGGLDSVLASLQEKQVGAFNATGLPLLSAEAFGVSPLPHVHSGFKEAYLSVRRPLLQLLHTAAGGEGKLAEEGWEVLCTGHSMGGSLAMLLSHELSEALPRNRISMYSYGQPRTGNSAFAARYDRANGDSFRIVNEWDVIARFPRAQNASVFDYEHAARTVLPNYLGCDEGIWVEGEQPGQCPLRDLRPLEQPGPDGAAPSRLPANLSPLFLAAEWNLLNSLITGAALSSHLEYRYLEGLEGGLQRKVEAERARARRLAEQLLQQREEQERRGSGDQGTWVPKVAMV